jgi:hypothetical protein
VLLIEDFCPRFADDNFTNPTCNHAMVYQALLEDFEPKNRTKCHAPATGMFSHLPSPISFFLAPPC